MKLYMKQKVFSWKARFSIKDANGEDRYYVEGELLSWGKKLHLLDHNRREVAFIKEKMPDLRGKFEIYVNEERVLEIIRDSFFLRSRFHLEGNNWQVKGNVRRYQYQIMAGDQQIASIQKVSFSWGASYEIDIPTLEDTPAVLATVLAIDAVVFGESSTGKLLDIVGMFG